MLRRVLTILLMTVFLVAGLRLWQLPQEWRSLAAAPAMADSDAPSKSAEHKEDKKDDKAADKEKPLEDSAELLPGPGADGLVTPPDTTEKKATIPAEFDPYADETRPVREIQLLEKIAKQKQDLDARETDIATREALLQANEEKLNQKAQELATLKTQIEGLLKDSQAQQDAQTKSLVAVYEKMKPKDAARIFNDLDPKTLMNIAGAMKETKLSPILAAMDATKAQMVTIKLAARTKNLPSDAPVPSAVAKPATTAAPVAATPPIAASEAIAVHKTAEPAATSAIATTPPASPIVTPAIPAPAAETTPAVTAAPSASAAITPNAAPTTTDTSAINPAKADKLPVKPPATVTAEPTPVPSTAKTP